MPEKDTFYKNRLDLQQKNRGLEHLKGFMLPERCQTLEKVLSYRTRHLCVVAENVYQPLNASALIRSCDVFGIQDFYVIEKNNRFSPDSEVAMGAQKWISTYRYPPQKEKDNTRDCIEQLRKQGYRIVATSPHRDGYEPENFPLEGKAAIFFGTEKEGLSDEVLRQADAFLKIPMYGFTESLNVSVSCAVALSRLIERLHRSPIPWGLSPEEKTELYFEWAAKSVRSSDKILERFFEKEND